MKCDAFLLLILLSVMKGASRKNSCCAVRQRSGVCYETRMAEA